MMKSIIVSFSLIISSFIGYSQEALNELIGSPNKNPSSWSASSIQWDTVFQDGSKLAILEGPRNIPGRAFSYAFYLPKGQWVAPHWHCVDARVYVASGVLRLGYGEELKKENTEIYPEGTYFVVPYKVSHFEGAEEDTIIFGTGAGPWCTYEH